VTDDQAERLIGVVMNLVDQIAESNGALRAHATCIDQLIAVLLSGDNEHQSTKEIVQPSTRGARPSTLDDY
jgi:predicted ATPase